MSDLTTKPLPKLNLRLPTDMKTLLEREARMNASSLNSEVVRAIRERMHRQGTPQRMEG